MDGAKESILSQGPTTGAQGRRAPTTATCSTTKKLPDTRSAGIVRVSSAGALCTVSGLVFTRAPSPAARQVARRPGPSAKAGRRGRAEEARTGSERSSGARPWATPSGQEAARKGRSAVRPAKTTRGPITSSGGGSDPSPSGPKRGATEPSAGGRRGEEVFGGPLRSEVSISGALVPTVSINPVSETAGGRSRRRAEP